MTIDKIQQRFLFDEIDTSTNEAAGDSIRRLKNKLLADETCRLLFGDSTSLLDDIMNHPLAIDYFNVYLSLPIFGQRVLYHRITHQLDFDPPFIAKHQTSEPMYEDAKQWLIHCRLDHYIHTDIYIESLLSLLLINSDKIKDSTSKLHSFVEWKEGDVEKGRQTFFTVTDVRQFHQFLLSTSGIKYWNFFIDSMRFLRCRYSSQSNRIDISHLNFIYKYYSKQWEMPSITIDLQNSKMPNSSTPNEIWFQMTINAMHQLREYWLPRYFSQLVLSTQLKIKRSTAKQIKSTIKTPSETPINSRSNYPSNTDQLKLVKHTLGNISYLDYNPRQYIRFQSSVQHDFQQETEEFNQLADENNIPIQTQDKIVFENASLHCSIDEYATDGNIELFYRILISDSLAGSPFLEYISQTLLKIEAIPLQTYIRFMTDAEIVLSIPTGNFKQRILRQFISLYLEVTATDALPSQVFDDIEDQKIEFIQELLTHDSNQYLRLWKILLKITKFLMPHFLNYLKFDRLRFLIQGKSLTTPHIIDDLHHLLPSVNFEALQTVTHETKEVHSELTIINNCAGEFTDFLTSLISNQFNTTEKLINTDEHHEFRPLERLRPFNEDELETTLDNSVDGPITSHQSNITTLIDDISLHKRTEFMKLNSFETYTLEIMNSARTLFEIDRYVSNLMDDSRQHLERNDSLEATRTAVNPSISEEILRTDSSPLLITSDRNQSSSVSSATERKSSEKQNGILRRSLTRKVLSSIGSYFINPSALISPLNNISLNHSIHPIIYNYLKNNYLKPITEFTLHRQFDSHPPLSYGLIKELTIDDLGIGHLYLDLPETKLPLNDKVALKLKLYTDDHLEFLLADVKSYEIDSDIQELQLQLENFKLPDRILSLSKNISSPESIRFAPKDKSNEIKNTFVEKRLSFFLQNDDEQQLLKFIENQIDNHQWPSKEYIGMKGHRAWRALKLAADISSLDNAFMLNYHRDRDWISTDDDLGSFTERTHFIIRDFQRRIDKYNC